MGQSIATDANWATAAEDEIERQVDQALDWFRAQIIGVARTLREDLTKIRASLRTQAALRRLPGPGDLGT